MVKKLLTMLVLGIAAVTAAFAQDTNVALGKALSASSYTQTYVAANANDNSTSSYWESGAGAYPATLTLPLGSATTVSSVVVKLNPDAAWSTRTQTFAIEAILNGQSTWSNLKPSATYTFNPASGANSVTIAVSGSVTSIRLSFTANSGAPGAQVAEFQVWGQGSPVARSPYGGSNRPISNGAVIQAEDYDLGGQSVAYNDTTSGNTGNAYRTDGVDIEATGDSQGGAFNVGWIVDGEWLNYLVNVSAGTYSITARVASAGASVGDLQVLLDGTVLGTIPVDPTGGWQSYVDKTITGIALAAGTGRTLQLKAVSGGDFNLNFVRFSTSSATTYPLTVSSGSGSGSYLPGTPVAISALAPPDGQVFSGWTGGTPSAFANPSSASTTYTTQASAQTITATYTTLPSGNTYQAESATLSGGASVTTNHTGYLGTGFVEGYWAQGATTTFNVSVASAGWYDIGLRFGNGFAASSLSLYVNAVKTLVSSLPTTGSWDTWAVKTETVYLNSGSNQVAYKFDAGDGANVNLDQITVGATSLVRADLSVTDISWSPANPVEGQAVTFSAVVKNSGTGATPSSLHKVGFVIGGTTVSTATATTSLAAGAQTTLTASSTWTSGFGTYSVTANADPDNSLAEFSDSNNSRSESLSLAQIPGPDLVVLSVSSSPLNPQAGTAVSFTATVKNQGLDPATGSIAARVAVGATTLNGSVAGPLAAGATANITLSGTWTAVNGSTAVTTTADPSNTVAEANETNNAISTNVYVGRGANMPYTKIEAEAPTVATTGTKLTPNFNLADFAGEASGRSAVKLDANGQYVEFTLTAPANAFVLRNAVAENTTGTLSVSVNGVSKGTIAVSSKYSYVYASPTSLGQLGYNNTPGGTAYWLYEDGNMMLDQVYPVGAKIRITKNAGDVAWAYIDFIQPENVAPAATNPDPSKYVQVSASKSIDQALQDFRADNTKLGIFIPAGTWTITNKIFLYGRATQIIGAGPWHTKLQAPQDQSNTDVGFNIGAAANGSTIKDLSAWGNYQYRIDGPGKFIDGNGMQNVTVDNVWVEHFVCLYWGVGSSNNTFKNCRIMNTFADGINMTNGSNNNVITNCDARANGDDAFALFSAADAGGSYNTGNQYTYDTATCTRRAAAFAVYGGSNNLYQNLYGADTLTYPGITINSYSFGYNTLGFGTQDCVFDGITLDRTGGDFWTSVGSDDHFNDYQNFAAIWFYAGDRAFQNILVKNVDINSPVYFGVMFQCMYPNPQTMNNIRLENVTINNAPRYGIKLVTKAEQGQGPPVGGASFTNVKVYNSGIAPIFGQAGSPGFTVTKLGTGNNW